MMACACDTCHHFLDDVRPCVATALVGPNGTLALRRLREGEKPQRASAHFCSQDCLVDFLGKWLSEQLPELTTTLTEAATVIAMPAPERREATPAEMAEQNALLGSILGSSHA